MRCSPSWFPSALVLACLVASVPSRAAAQACCAGASTLSPTRLTESESYAIGLQLRASYVAGQFTGAGLWAPSPDGDLERDFAEDLFAVVRVRERLQAGLLAPIVQTWRAVPGLSDVGVGPGDLKASARYDLLAPGESPLWPGIAFVAGLSLPTGRPVESATHALAADATGLGSATFLGGIALEKPVDHLLLQFTGTVQQQLAREVRSLTETFGPQVALTFAAGWAFDSGPGIAAVAGWKRDGAAALDGAPVLGSKRTLATVGFAGGGYVSTEWRAQGSISWPIPIAGFGRASPGAPGLQVAFIRSWN